MVRRVIPASMKGFYDTYHFAPAVVDGEQLRCSGVLGINPTDNSIPADPESQFTRAFDNLREVLAAAGASTTDLVELITFHVGLQAHLEVFMKVKDRYIADPYPAWTAIGISELALPGSLVEIRAIARLPG